MSKFQVGDHVKFSDRYLNTGRVYVDNNALSQYRGTILEMEGEDENLEDVWFVGGDEGSGRFNWIGWWGVNLSLVEAAKPLTMEDALGGAY